jgi:alkaline phosphatase
MLRIEAELTSNLLKIPLFPSVADSACSATAYLTGVKANYGTIGLSAAVIQNNCLGQNNTANHVDSVFKHAQDKGMRTGLVTNTRITHATPAGAYAHIANRNWENDARIKRDGHDPETCHDVAYQLIHSKVGKRLNVIFGGGRREFLAEHEKDSEGNFGKRSDNNLIKQWSHIHRKKYSKYIESREQLINLDTKVDKVLGLFASDHLPFNLDDEDGEKPTLSEMVSKALDILESKNDEKGFFLFVEGGKIDHAHHYNVAQKALDETLEFEKAVQLARLRTDEEETLIVVTSDHSHSFTVSGYASRGHNILGLNDGMKSLDGLPYTTLGYENGPSYFQSIDKNGKRKNLENVDLNDKEFAFPSSVPLALETHGGEDVGVFSSVSFQSVKTCQ